ncbi:reverse transcriptase domain-containing protein [Tanacetum coccineum]
MNPYFAMNPNDDEEERQPNAFDVDDESDVYFLQQAYEYHETLVEDEKRPVLTRNPIYRDREGAEDRLMGDYFDDPFRPDATSRMSLSVIMKCTAAKRQLAYGTTPDAFDEYLQMSERTARDWTLRNNTTTARQYHVNSIRRIMYSCIIMHNMILKDQKMAVTDWNEVYVNPSRNMQRTWVERFETHRQKIKELRDRETHISLQHNLMEHIWHEVKHEDEDEDF